MGSDTQAIKLADVLDGHDLLDEACPAEVVIGGKNCGGARHAAALEEDIEL